MTDKAKKVGRPTDYNQKLANLICERVVTHDLGLKRLCDMYDDMPAKITINKWRYKYPEFATQYAQAKIQQVEFFVEEIQELCDVPSYEDTEGITRVDSGLVARQRLKVDTLKWQASKLVGRLYGKDERVNLRFPSDIINGNALVEMSATVFTALSNKEISVEQAKTLIGAIKDYSSTIVISDLSSRLDQLKNTTNNPVNFNGE